MIPRPEQLETIARVTEGDLTEIPFGVLLHSMAVTRRSAVLESAIGDSEVARVPMADSKTSSTVDMFTIALEEEGDGAVMKLAWGEAAWTVPVKAAK